MGRCKQENHCTNHPWCSATGRCFKESASAPQVKAITNSEKRYYCSFCGKSDLEVRSLVDSDTAAICCECVELAAEVIRHYKTSGELEYASWFRSEERK